jgi:phage protein D
MAIDLLTPQYGMVFSYRGKDDYAVPSSRIISMNYAEKHRGSDTLEASLDNGDGAMWYAAPLLTKNSRVVVSFGYPGLMRGPVEMRSAGLPTGGDTLTVKARVKTNRKRSGIPDGARSRSWKDVAATEVVEALAAEMGYKGKSLFIDHDFEKRVQVTQANETDLEFLFRLADMSDRRFWIDETGFHFQLPGRDMQPVASFRKAQDVLQPGVIIDYSVPKLATRIPNKVRLMARDPLTRTTIDRTVAITQTGLPVLSGEPAVDDDDDTELVLPAFNMTDASVLSEATGYMRDLKLGAVRLELTVFGDPTVRPGKTVFVVGLADPIDGLWYVRESTHELGDGYTTRVLLGREGHKKRAKKRTTTAQPTAAATSTDVGSGEYQRSPVSY